MFRILCFGARVQAPKFLTLFRMSKNGEQVYYAVGRGREIGIYNSWSECKAQIDGVANAKYRKFFSLPEAEEFVKFWKNYSSPSKESQVERNENSVSNYRKNGGNNRIRRRKNERNGVKSKPEKLIPLGVAENIVQKSEVVGLQPYVSPIPSPLRIQFNVTGRSQKNFSQKEKETGPNMERSDFLKRSYSVGTEVDFLVPNQNSCNSYKSPLVKRVEAFQSSNYDSQSDNVLSEPVIKMEVVEKDEELCSKLPKCLTVVETALRGIASGRSTESDKIRNTLKAFLDRVLQTNCHVAPQIECGGSVIDLDKTKNAREVEREEATPGQQQSVILSPKEPASSLTAKNPDILALNLRLDSFERRFDACLKEVGAIGSEISHIKNEIKEMKESLGQCGSSSWSPRKRKDGLLQTTLSFSSPNKSEHSRMEYSSRSYTTDQSASSKEAECGEYKTNRRKRRRLSRSDSTGSDKHFAEDRDDDILSRIKIEEVEYTSFCLDENDFVEVYTDGACHYNGERDAKAGIGIWFGDSHPLNVSEPVMGSATNNVAEIQAARIAIELAVKAGVKKLKILTDSEFLINCVTKWMHRWKRNGWTLVKGGTVKNRKELEKLDKAASKITVRWEKVLAHSGIKGNEMADRLANQGAEKYGR